MRRRIVAAAVALTLALALVGVAGCTRVPLEDVEGSRGLQVDKQSVALQGAEKLDARIGMAAGQLKLDAGGPAAMDAEFSYSPRTWKPEVDYSVEGSTGVLVVEQPDPASGFDMMGDTRNDWDLKLATGVPLDLDVKLGAGESDIDLSGLDVRTLNVLTGAGETNVDLSGPRTSDVNARIEAGVGELTVLVPSDVGVRVRTSSEGIGDSTFEGLHKDGSDYVNDVYATSSVKIEITLHRGIGEVTVKTVP
jgi:hypothetical protein